MDVEEQARAVSAFGSKVFRGIFQNTHSPNVTVSPLALGMALMATASGASGDTKQELLNTFQISTLDLESCQALLRY
jgi:serine protease inhibitor